MLTDPASRRQRALLAQLAAGGPSAPARGPTAGVAAIIPRATAAAAQPLVPPLNRFKSALAAREKQIGMWSGLGSSLSTDILADAGVSRCYIQSDRPARTPGAARAAGAACCCCLICFSLLLLPERRCCSRLNFFSSLFCCYGCCC